MIQNNEEFKQRVLSCYWSRLLLKCDTCKEEIRCRYMPLVDGYTLLASCSDGCRKWTIPASLDPLRETFRPWTTLEKDRLNYLYQRGKLCKCPVDGAALATFCIRPSPTTRRIKLRCPRCLFSSELSLPATQGNDVRLRSSD